VLILRIAHYHVGIRTASSPARGLAAHVFTRQTVESVFWYGLSSLAFVIVQLVAASERSGLNLVHYTTSRRAVLNEKPVYFFCAALAAGLWQALMHRIFDEDRLDLIGLLPNAKKTGLVRKDGPGVLTTMINVAVQKWLPADTAAAATQAAGSLAEILPSRVPDVLVAAFARSVVVAFVTFPAYFIVLRGPARAWALRLLRPFVNLSRSNAMPAGFPVDVTFMLRCAYYIFHLIVIWHVANRSFTAFMAQEPLKNGLPLTADSLDANGSLLNGLKSRKLRYQVGRVTA